MRNKPCNDNRLLSRRRQLTEIGRYAFPWLIEAGKREKENGVFPVRLTDYYKKRDDVEVAGFVELLIPDGKSRERLILEIRSLIGDEPWKMVTDRLFLTMSPTDDEEQWLNKPTLSKRDVMALMEWIYDVRVRKNESLEYVLQCELKGRRTDIGSLTDVIGKSIAARQRMHLLMAEMTINDGFGKGLWTSIPVESLQCPLTNDVLLLLCHFYRLEKIDESNVNEILEFIGFDRPVDFLYTTWAVMRMRNGAHRDEINSFLSSFSGHLAEKKMVRYCSGLKYYKRRLRDEVPGFY